MMAHANAAGLDTICTDNTLYVNHWLYMLAQKDESRHDGGLLLRALGGWVEPCIRRGDVGVLQM